MLMGGIELMNWACFDVGGLGRESTFLLWEWFNFVSEFYERVCLAE
jgi:hypothetical protein